MTEEGGGAGHRGGTGGTRLWVTGLGLVTPLGTGVEATWKRLVAGDRAIRPIRHFSTSKASDPPSPARSTASAPVDGPAGRARAPWRPWPRPRRCTHARLDPRKLRVGLVVGTTTGGMLETEQLLGRLHAEPDSREAAPPCSRTRFRRPAIALAERLGPFARVRTLSQRLLERGQRAGRRGRVAARGRGRRRRRRRGRRPLPAHPSAASTRSPRSIPSPAALSIAGAGARAWARARASWSSSARAAPRAGRTAPVAELARLGVRLRGAPHHQPRPRRQHGGLAHLPGAGARGAVLRRTSTTSTRTARAPRLNDRVEAAALARALGAEVARVPVSSSKGQLGHCAGGRGRDRGGDHRARRPASRAGAHGGARGD